MSITITTTNPSTFHFFSDLPPELRNQIWRNALPEKVRPGLYFYKKGYWCPRRLTESDEGYDPVRDDLNLLFEFRHDLLDKPQLELPLVFVNREARGIALTWVREQGITIRPRPNGNGGQYPAFVLPFDPMRDALYIAFDDWNDCMMEPYDRMEEPDLLDQNVEFIPEVTHIAVSEALLRREAAAIGGMFYHFYWLKVLFIIVDAPPDLKPVGNDMEVEQRWEFESAPGGTFFWKRDHGSFKFEGGEYLSIYEPLYKFIEEVVQGLSDYLASNGIISLEIRPAFAIRK